MQTGVPLYNKDKISLIAKKKKKKKRPPDLEKFGWMDAKQAIFFIWPNYVQCIESFIYNRRLVFRYLCEKISIILCVNDLIQNFQLFLKEELLQQP